MAGEGTHEAAGHATASVAAAGVAMEVDMVDTGADMETPMLAMATGATATEIPTLVATGVAMELLKGMVAPLEVRVAR